MEATFWARIRDFVRPVADEDLHDLHQHALRGVRALSLCLALLAPCGPFFLLAEQVHLHRALLLLPFHLGFYAALAALSQREFGRRHTSVLVTLLALAILSDITVGGGWLQQEPHAASQLFAVVTPMIVALFTPWRPLAMLALLPFVLAAGHAGQHLFGLPLPMSQATVTNGAFVFALGSAIAIQSKRRLWLRFEQTKQRLASAESEANARSAEALERAAEMRRVLENVDEAFVRISPGGELSSEQPALLARWFGDSADPRFSEHLRLLDPVRADAFLLGFEQLLEGVLPPEVAIDQLPARVGSGSRTLSLRYRPVLENDVLRELFVVVSDVSDQVRREQAEAERRNLLGAIKHILRDRDGFTQFAHEATALVEEITSGDFSHDEILRQVHTLKGNAAAFEIETVAQLCHEIEDRLIEEHAGLSPAECERLLAVWRPIATLAGGAAADDAAASALSVGKDEHSRLLAMVLDGASRTEIAARMQSWELEPARRRLERLADRARATALRLEKGQVEIAIDDGGVRVPEREWGAFWAALVHVVRNALDHGLEPAEERVQGGKPAYGKLTLRTAVEDGSVIVEISDDGRGIDWERIRAKAKSGGLPHSTHQDLVEAMFTDGISSRDVANEFSGRGVGMSAVREACRELGGSLEVTSVAGSGSRFTARFPHPRTSMVAAA